MAASLWRSNGVTYFDATLVTAPPPIGRQQRRAVTCASAVRLSVGWSGLPVFTARLDGCWWYWEKCNVVPSAVGIDTAARLKVGFWTFHTQTFEGRVLFVREDCCHPPVLTVKCRLAGLADASLALACAPVRADWHLPCSTNYGKRLYTVVCHISSVSTRQFWWSGVCSLRVGLEALAV